MSSEIDKELYKCKAVCMSDDETIVCGYYYTNACDFIDVENIDYEKKIKYPTTAHEINIYTLCRNTGIKLHDSTYLYEYDFVEYWNGLRSKQLGYIEWDDYSQRYRIRTSANYSSKIDIKGNNINVVGNVILYKNDMPKFQKYSDEREKNPTKDVTVECRSTQHLNKQAKMFLPK